MSAATRHALADRYLRRLREAARALPRAHQTELVAEIEAHIAAGLEEAGTDAAVRNLLDDLGEPEEIVAAALPPPPPPARRGRAALALGLVAAPLSLIPFYGWFVSIPLGVGAIAMGISARRHARRGGNSDSAATGGLVAGAVAVSVPLLVVAVFLPWGFMTETIEVVPESEFQVNPDLAPGPPQPPLEPPPPVPEEPAGPMPGQPTPPARTPRTGGVVRVVAVSHGALTAAEVRGDRGGAARRRGPCVRRGTPRCQGRDPGGPRGCAHGPGG